MRVSLPEALLRACEELRRDCARGVSLIYHHPGKVKYSSKTAFELNKKPAGKAGVKVGDRVGVLGSKVPTGEIMANEVILGVPATVASGATKAEHKH
ncbi:MAG: hypothetical protein JNL98_36465 [Bryobacterales bacterium]|nr:hypothetical protein [Bryobacterales bacterium]